MSDSPIINEYAELLKSTIIRGDSTQEEALKLQTPVHNLIEKMRPKKLYRYRICNENNFDALLNDKIFFSSPFYFNDPHDCLSYIDSKKIESLLSEIEPEYVKQHMREMRNSTHLLSENFTPNILPVVKMIYESVKSLDDIGFNDLMEKLDTNIAGYDILTNEFSKIIEYNRSLNLKNARQDTYMVCFAQNFDSTLMWAHYADSHKGFVLEYDTDEIMAVSHNCAFCKDKDSCPSVHLLDLYPVLYSNERYDATEYELETLKIQLSGYYGVKTPFCSPDKLFHIKSNTFKGLDWAYEKEWRLIYSCGYNHPNLKFLPLKPKAIYLGSQISTSNKRIIEKLIDGKELPLYHLYNDTDNKNYVLDYKTLSNENEVK